MGDDRGGIAMLAESVAALMGDPENVVLARSILGTCDPMEIAQSVDEFVLRQTGRCVRDCSLCEKSSSQRIANRSMRPERMFLPILLVVSTILIPREDGALMASEGPLLLRRVAASWRSE